MCCIPVDVDSRAAFSARKQMVWTSHSGNRLVIIDVLHKTVVLISAPVRLKAYILLLLQGHNVNLLNLGITIKDHYMEIDNPKCSKHSKGKTNFPCNNNGLFQYDTGIN
jgi:hypothetical protein